MDFTIDGVAYKARQMNAFDQLSLMSKLSPLLASGLPELLPLIREIRNLPPKEVKVDGVKRLVPAGLLDLPLEESVGKLAPLASALSKMSDADRRAVIEPCLAVVEKDIGSGKFAPIWAGEVGRALFPEFNTNAILVLRVAFAVISGTFASFFPASR